jgi:hypothetical protein
MPRLIQILNPKTDRWVKIDCDVGNIVGHKQSPGPYKGIPIHEGKKVINHDG